MAQKEKIILQILFSIERKEKDFERLSRGLDVIKPLAQPYNKAHPDFLL
jgi:hypothetical protein